MKIDYKDHYDKDYWTFSKQYTRADGTVGKYNNPSLEWGGFDEIARALLPLLPKEGTLLDIGCGGGALASRMSPQLDPWGIDISKYAVENCVPSMQDKVGLCDITKTPKSIHTYRAIKQDTEVAGKNIPMYRPKKFPNPFDVITATDLMEHIYEEDLDKTFTWMWDKLKKNGFMFLLIAVDKNEFVLGKGQEVPKGYEEVAVSGHVNVRKWQYWAKFFRNYNVSIRWDLMYRFQAARAEVEWWRNMPQWGHDFTFFLQKV